MIQLMKILGDDYIVWDKDATIKYRRPARETVFTEFVFTKDDIELIKSEISKNGEFNLVKTPNIVNKDGIVIAELHKTIYAADKKFYKTKRKLKKASK